MNVDTLIRLLVPDAPRRFTGQRWLNIILRSLHLVGVAGIGSGFFFDMEEPLWLPFWQLTVATGLGLMALYVWTTALWLFQLKGVVILVKLLLLWLAMFNPAWRAELFALVILLSAVIAHAPGPVRGYMVLWKSRATGHC